MYHHTKDFNSSKSVIKVTDMSTDGGDKNF